MTYGNTKGNDMPKAKIAISLDRGLLEKVDGFVRDGGWPSRSRAIEEAVSEKLARMGRTRLAAECAKLDRLEEKEMAEEGLSEEASGWPEY